LKAVEAIEGALGEVQGMMSTLSQLVSEQGASIHRIDTHANLTLEHTQSANVWLLKYQRAIAGRRGWMIKLFMIVAIIATIMLLFY
jgi:t-SNARE complex subunit (syntaxin)